MTSPPARPLPDRRRRPRTATPAARDRYLAVLGPAPFRLRVVFLLLFTSSVAWRKGTYYDGGFDVVVVAKAAVTGLAFLLVLTVPRSAEAWGRLRAAPVVWVACYLGISVVGALLHDTVVATGVLSVRIALLAGILVLVVATYRFAEIVPAMTGSMIALVAFGAATGVSSLAETGRLYGGIPPINANEICFLLSVPTVLTVWRCVDGRAGRGEYLLLAVLLGTIWLTGARTGLASLGIACLLVVALSPRVSASVTALASLAVPALVYVAFFTSVAADYVGRGGVSNVTTLNSRTVAWSAALDYPQTTAEHLFGFGIALKQIPVSAAYRSEQILDSSWFSAFLQAGLLGVLVLAGLVVSTLAAAARRRDLAVVLVPLTVLMAVSSILESGLLDTTPAFIVLMVTGLVAGSTLAARAEPEGVPEPAVAADPPQAGPAVPFRGPARR